jgi:hypothetical protein
MVTITMATTYHYYGNHVPLLWQPCTITMATMYHYYGNRYYCSGLSRPLTKMFQSVKMVPIIIIIIKIIKTEYEQVLL